MTDHYLGWDVGGWNCEKNPNSRDALCVLRDSGSLEVVGSITRANLRDTINRFDTLDKMVNSFCNAEIGAGDRLYLAIDTPLGFSRAFRRLICDDVNADEIPIDNAQNPYVYRQTEAWLFERGFSPLSAVKDMIGSQATKGIHLLAKTRLRSNVNVPGVWRSSDERITAFEAYPSPCKKSRLIHSYLDKLQLSKDLHPDQRDAAVCAIVAYLYAKCYHQLVPPPAGVDPREGWVWIPVDAIPS